MRAITGMTMFAAGLLLAQSSSVRADLLLNGFFFPSDTAPTIQRYTDAGTYVGQVASIPDETIDGTTVDGKGVIYGVGNTLGQARIVRVAGAQITESSPVQYRVPGELVIGWGGHLFGRSMKFDASSLTGVLEFMPQTGAFVRNAVPVSGTLLGGIPSGPLPQTIAFDPNFPAQGDRIAGALYVSTVTSPGPSVTSRYVQLTDGTIAKSGAFTIAKASRMTVDPSDSTLLLVSGNSLVRYGSDTGTILGTFMTLADPIFDLEFAPDQSLWVFTGGPSGHQMYHLDHAGNALGAPLTLPSGFSDFAYLPVPEPAACTLLGAGAAILLARRRR